MCSKEYGSLFCTSLNNSHAASKSEAKQIKTTIVVNYPSTCDNILSATNHMQSNTKIQTIKIYFTSAICFGWTILEFSTEIPQRKSMQICLHLHFRKMASFKSCAQEFAKNDQVF